MSSIDLSPTRRLSAHPGMPSLCEECPLPLHSPFRCMWLTLTGTHGLALTVRRAWLVLFSLVFLIGFVFGAALMGAYTVNRVAQAHVRMAR